MHKTFLAAALTVTFAAMAGPALAQASFPERPVTLVVPYAPGGPTDTAGRILMQALQEETGATFIVENAPGAGATLGASRVARASGDGYTLLWGGKSTHALAPHLRPDLAYDAQASFAPVAMVGSQPYIVTVSAGSPYPSLADLVAHGKQNPGTLNLSSPGAGSAPHLATELLLLGTGVQALHVPYKGGAPAMMAVLAGETDFYLDTPTLPKAQAAGGKARLLAVTSPERLSDLPDLPTVGEAGYNNLAMKTWFGVYAPAGTPDAVVAWLNEKMNTVMRKPKVAEQLEAAGFEVELMSPAQFAQFNQAERERWGQIIRDAKVSIQSP